MAQTPPMVLEVIVQRGRTATDELTVDEQNWLMGEGTIAAAMGGERLMDRDWRIRAAYERGRDDGVNYGPLP